MRYCTIAKCLFFDKAFLCELATSELETTSVSWHHLSWHLLSLHHLFPLSEIISKKEEYGIENVLSSKIFPLLIKK